MRNSILALLGAIFTLAALSACGSGPNYSGNGNDFVVTGTVKEVILNGFLWEEDYREVKLDPATTKVESAEGEASGWFTRSGLFQSDENNFTFTSGYRDPRLDSWSPVFVEPGRIRNAEGYPSDITKLNVGDVIEISGKIHASKSGKSSPYRAVFHLIKVTGP